MSDLNIHTIYWLVANITKKLGAWGVLGIVLLVSSFVFYTTKSAALNQLTEQAKAQSINRQAQAAVVAPIETKPIVQNNAQDIAAFYERFPTTRALPDILSAINHIATKQNLVLNSGDYKLNKIKQNKQSNSQALTQYEMVLPVKGAYINIRTFIVEVLKQEPALALLDVQIKRESTLIPTVDARLTFALFVKSAS